MFIFKRQLQCVLLLQIYLLISFAFLIQTTSNSAQHLLVPVARHLSSLKSIGLTEFGKLYKSIIPPPSDLSLKANGRFRHSCLEPQRDSSQMHLAFFKQQQLRQKRSAEEYNMDLNPLFQTDSNRFQCTDLLFFFTAVS